MQHTHTYHLYLHSNTHATHSSHHHKSKHGDRQKTKCQVYWSRRRKANPFFANGKTEPEPNINGKSGNLATVKWQTFVGRERANGTRETLRCKDHCSHRPWEEEQPCDEELLTFWDSFLSFVIANSLPTHPTYCLHDWYWIFSLVMPYWGQL
jgi:hypothetical protein